MPRTSITPMLSDLKYQKLAAQTEREVFMNSVLKASYVKMDDVMITWDSIQTVVKNYLLGIPAASIPLILGKEKDEAIRIMRDFIWDYLNDAEKLEKEIILLRNKKMTKYKAKIDETQKNQTRLTSNVTRVKV